MHYDLTLVQEGYLAMNFLLKLKSSCLLAVIDWCCIILLTCSIWLIWSDSDYRKDKNRTIATSDGGTSQGAGSSDWYGLILIIVWLSVSRNNFCRVYREALYSRFSWLSYDRYLVFEFPHFRQSTFCSLYRTRDTMSRIENYLSFLVRVIFFPITDLLTRIHELFSKIGFVVPFIFSTSLLSFFIVSLC
jgi:hypothetical protein